MRQRAWIITVDILQIDPLAFSKFILANRCVLCIALSILKSLFFLFETPICLQILHLFLAKWRKTKYKGLALQNTKTSRSIDVLWVPLSTVSFLQILGYDLEDLMTNGPEEKLRA